MIKYNTPSMFEAVDKEREIKLSAFNNGTTVEVHFTVEYAFAVRKGMSAKDKLAITRWLLSTFLQLRTWANTHGHTLVAQCYGGDGVDRVKMLKRLGFTYVEGNLVLLPKQ